MRSIDQVLECKMRRGLFFQNWLVGGGSGHAVHPHPGVMMFLSTLFLSEVILIITTSTHRNMYYKDLFTLRHFRLFFPPFLRRSEMPDRK